MNVEKHNLLPSFSGSELLPGFESQKKIQALLILANIKSNNKKDALIDYFVNGTPQTTCALMYGLSQSTIANAAAIMKKKHKLALLVAHYDH